MNIVVDVNNEKEKEKILADTSRQFHLPSILTYHLYYRLNGYECLVCFTIISICVYAECSKVYKDCDKIVDAGEHFDFPSCFLEIMFTIIK